MSSTTTTDGTLPESKRFRPISQAFERVTGNRLPPVSCHRYATKGVGGIFLKSYMVGRRRMTTDHDVREFIRLRTEASTPNAVALQQAAPDSTKNALNQELGLA